MLKSNTYSAFWAFGLCLFTTTALMAQNDIIQPGLEGQPLLEALVNSYKPNNVLSYSGARDIMYGDIYKVNDSVTCVYSGYRLYLPPGVNPTDHLYQNGSNNGINAEHTYPRSKGAEVGNGLSDMHHLFPTKSNVNAARGNLAFGDNPDNLTTEWFFENIIVTVTPNISIRDQFSEYRPNLFEPREDHKGNVARAMFYFYTMYEDQALAADPGFFESQRTTLCQWHISDPVDITEWRRTHRIATFQSGKPNPFVLDCTLPSRTYCVDENLVCVTDVHEPMAASAVLWDNMVIFGDGAAWTLQAESKMASQWQILLTDVSGRTLYRAQNDVSEGLQTIQIPLSPSRSLKVLSVQGVGKDGTWQQFSKLVW